MQADEPSKSPLQAAVQILTFDPGVYSLTFGTERSVESDIGFVFPRARLDAPSVGPGLVVVALQGENGWLARPGDTAMIQVTGARMSLLLTTYQIEGANAAPLLRVNRIADFVTQDQASASPLAPTPATPAGPAVSGLVHVGGQGDVLLGADGWAGAQGGSGGLVEGFVIAAPAGFEPTDVEYQGVLGVDWTTPWTGAGEFCGSRGLALPLLGFTVRLSARVGAVLRCTYRARFQDGSVAEASDGTVCTSPSGAPVEAIWVSWAPRRVVGPGADASTPPGKDAGPAPASSAVPTLPSQKAAPRERAAPKPSKAAAPALRSKSAPSARKANPPKPNKAAAPAAKSKPVPKTGKATRGESGTRTKSAAGRSSRHGRSR